MTALRGGEWNELKTNRRNDSFQTNEIFTEYSQVPGQQGSPRNQLKLCCLPLMLHSVGAVLEGKLKYMFQNKYKLLNSPWIDKDTFTGIKSTCT